MVPFPLCPSIRLTQANGGREKRRDRRSEFCAHHDTVVIHSLYHKRRRQHSFVLFPLCWHLSFPSSGRGDSSAALPPQQFPLITDLCAADRPEDRPLNERQSGMMLPPPLLALAFSPVVEESEKGGGKEEGAGWFVRSNLSPPPSSSPCPALKLPRPSRARGERMTIAGTPAICLGVGMTARDNYANF